MGNDVVIAQTTSDDEDQAKALARGAVENKLAAGVHIDALLSVHQLSFPATDRRPRP